MLETHTDAGLKVLICPHIPITTVKTISDTVAYVQIFCNRKTKGLLATFQNFTKNEITLKDLKDATRNTVSDATLLEQANLAILLGLPVKELPELFKCAFRIGMALGLEPSKAIESLCKGIGRKSRLILDNLGIVFPAKKAYEKYPELDKDSAWKRYAIDCIKEKAQKL